MDWQNFANPFLSFKDMRQYTGKKIGLVLILLAGIFACSKKEAAEKDNNTGAAADRKAVLIQLADEIIIPSYANFKLKLDVMVSKTNAFGNAPTVTSLQELRTAWVDAYKEWQKVEILDFGPAEMYVLRGYMNIYPANVTKITANIAAGNANLDLPTNYTASGFPGLDYLINGAGNNDAEIVAFYTAPTDGAKRIAYLKTLAVKMSAIFNQVSADWNGAYRETFVNKTTIDASSPFSSLVNGYVRSYESAIRSGKFGIPSGAMENGTVSPQNVEAYYKKDISLTLAKTAHQAAIDFFNGKSVKSGTEGPSLKTYLNSLPSSTTLAAGINAQFAATTQKLNAINTENLSSVVQNNNQQMIDVYNEMHKSVPLLKVDMTSAMSISISYTDNDGD